MKGIYIAMTALLMSIALTGCEDDIDLLVTDLQLSRALSPIELEARIRNRTTIELTWVVKSDVDHYVVEFSEDSLEFNSIIRTVSVNPDELPLQETFFGDTRYSARVKAVSSEGAGDSNWSAITVLTDSENIFSPLLNADIEPLQVTLKWPTGSEVSHFVINPGGDQRDITAGEKTAGQATITGLADLTKYNVTMYNGNSVRGKVSFKTLVDPNGPNTTVVTAAEDLNAVITAAAPGHRLVLEPGDYTAYSGSITIDKSITIRGQYPWNKPMVHVQFSLENGAAEIVVGDVDMNGDATLSDAFRYNTASVTYGSFVLEGSYIHDFDRSFVAGNVASTVASVSIDDCVVTNILTNGGDHIDFRNTHLTNLSVTNSTFNNVAPGRDFIRIDAASGFSGTGLNTDVVVDHCTLYGVSNTTDRILYVRFNSNTLAVTNTIIAATDGYFTNQGSSSQPTCSKNNYFNAVGFYTPAYVSNAKIDESGNHTTLDPGFSNAAIGDFTVSNQSLIDSGVGDPRWLR